MNHQTHNNYRTKSGRISMKAIREIAQKITDQFEVEKIILFGSYANGKPTRASDVDLLVVMNTKKRTLEQRYDIYKSLVPVHFALDIIVRTEDDIQRRIPQGDWFLKDVYETGRILYAK